MKGDERILTSLSLHRPNTCVLKEQPIVHLIVLASSFGKADLVVRIISINEVLHDTARLEEIDGLAVGKVISQCWDAAIGVDLQELPIPQHIAVRIMGRTLC